MIEGASRRPTEQGAAVAGLLAALLPLAVLAVLLAGALADGLPRLAQGSLYAAAADTLLLTGLTAAVAVPVGAGAAIYLEEYSRQSRLARLAEANVSLLAGVPSVIYGLVGLEVFARSLRLGGGLLAGALTLSLLTVPLVVLSSRRALRAVPGALREAAHALGASRLQVVRAVVLPAALPGILAGAALAVCRAMGEAAPLLVLGALAHEASAPGAEPPLAALPVQIFRWADGGLAADASAGIVVLMAAMLLLSGLALALRGRRAR